MRVHPRARPSHQLASLLVIAMFTAVQASQAQPEDLDRWLEIRSANFSMLTDADAQRGEDILRALEEFRAVFARLAPEVELRSPVPTRILAFRDDSAYAPYRTEKEKGEGRILGQFLSHRDGNFITLDADPSAIGSYGVIYHEYVHFMLRNSFPTVPLWLHEGLAEYYRTFQSDGETVILGTPVEAHVARLKHRLQLELGEVVALDSDRSGHGNPSAPPEDFYAQSWLLVHYLLSGGEERLAWIADLLIAVHEGLDSLEAFERAVPQSLRKLEERLHTYVLEGQFPSAVLDVGALPVGSIQAARSASPADVLLELGRVLTRQGRLAEAENHLREALLWSPEDGDVLVGLAHIRDLEGRYAEAGELFEESVVNPPGDSLSYLQYGRHLLAAMERTRLAGDPERVRWLADQTHKAFRRAVEIDPAFVEAWAMLGYSYLFMEGDASAGIARLEEAYARLPNRLDLVLFRAQLLIKDARLDEAESLIREILIPRAGPEIAGAAMEELERGRYLVAADEAFSEDRIERGLQSLENALVVSTDPGVRAALERRIAAAKRRYGRAR